MSTNRVPIDSYYIVSAGYDVETKTFEVEFSSGIVYQYYDVPQALYNVFTSSNSKGNFLTRNISGKYRYARV